MTAKKEGIEASNLKNDEKLKTENPLSEKDEVKQAEERMARQSKKTDTSVAADLKNREHDK